MKSILILLAIVWSPALCTLGVDVSQLFSTSTYQCMKNNGYSFAIIRGYCSFGGNDPHIN